MTDCPDDLMRDLLPEYALGVLAAEDDAHVAVHLDSCQACRAELALLKTARAALALGVPRMDVAAIVSALPASPALSQPTLRLVPRSWASRHVWQYAAAAGLVLTVGGGVVWQRTSNAPSVRVADSAHVAAPVEFTQAPAPAPADGGITFGGGLSDLSLDELQALLAQMDSVRTLPSTDPESMTPVIAMN